MVTINQLVDVVEDIAGAKLARRYVLDAPKGVRGRNSDNTLIRERLGWEPGVSLRTGLEATYRWVFDQVFARALGTATNGRPARTAAAAPTGRASAESPTQNLAV
jgi:hypothetical protein